jgi:putative DNA primase/helicase
MPTSIISDDRWHRCATEHKPKKRNGAYRLAHDARIGWYRDWAAHDGVQTWRADGEHEAAPIDHARIALAREKERTRRISAMRGARDFWGRAQPMRQLHPYLARKKLAALGCAGLRVSGELLVIPVWHGEWIVSVQTINAGGEKRFWPGAPVKAGCYVIERKGAALTVFCEGLATGLAIFQSMRVARVIVCFDAGNLVPVVARIKPSGAVVIAADNDHETAQRIGVNPGLQKAQEAADSIGCGVAYPEGIMGSDWADALIEWQAEPDAWDRRAPLTPHRRIERLIQAQIGANT